MKKLVAVWLKIKLYFERKSNPHGFKSYADAWEEANKANPVSRGLLHEINNMHNTPMQTKDDFRWFVLFNYIEAIDVKLNRGKQNSFLRHIQRNIRISAEKYLK